MNIHPKSFEFNNKMCSKI